MCCCALAVPRPCIPPPYRIEADAPVHPLPGPPAHSPRLPHSSLLSPPNGRRAGPAASLPARLQLAAKAERLKRAQLREEVLDVAREERRRLLLLQSCNWVTEQTLEQRVQEALDNPVPLHADTRGG